MSRARDTADQINRVNSSAADATAITVDSSENVLIGRTSTADTAVGATLRPDGFVQSTRDGNIAADFNRNTSDGDIVRFSKGSSPVGSIGSRGTGTSYITLKSTSGAGAGLTGSDNRILPMDESALADNNTDLGMSTYRWKDAYLSGGVFLGGTGSANKLSDYEEGNCTLTLTGSTGAPNTAQTTTGKYTKVGNTVIVTAIFANRDVTGATGLVQVTGLPFTSIGEIHLGQFLNSRGDANQHAAYLPANSTNLYQSNKTGSSLSWGSTGPNVYAFFTITYMTS